MNFLIRKVRKWNQQKNHKINILGHFLKGKAFLSTPKHYKSFGDVHFKHQIQGHLTLTLRDFVSLPHPHWDFSMYFTKKGRKCKLKSQPFLTIPKFYECIGNVHLYLQIHEDLTITLNRFAFSMGFFNVFYQ